MDGWKRRCRASIQARLALLGLASGSIGVVCSVPSVRLLTRGGAIRAGTAGLFGRLDVGLDWRGVAAGSKLLYCSTVASKWKKIISDLCFGFQRCGVSTSAIWLTRLS